MLAFNEMVPRVALGTAPPAVVLKLASPKEMPVPVTVMPPGAPAAAPAEVDTELGALSALDPICTEPLVAVSVTVPALAPFCPRLASEEISEPPVICNADPLVGSGPLAINPIFPAFPTPLVEAMAVLPARLIVAPLIVTSPAAIAPLVVAVSVEPVSATAPGAVRLIVLGANAPLALEV